MTIDYNKSSALDVDHRHLTGNRHLAPGATKEKAQAADKNPKTTTSSRAISPPNLEVGVQIRDISHSRMTPIENKKGNNL